MAELFAKLFLLLSLALLESESTEQTVISKNHDLHKTGYCSSEIANLCGGFEEGYAKLATCMRGKLLMRQTASAVSNECKKEVRQFFKEAMQDPLDYLPELEACNQEIDKYCKMNQGPFVMACLKRSSKRLGDRCKAVVLEEQKLEAQTIEIDPLINMACHEDLQKLCASASPEGGRQKQCLQRNRPLLSEDCAANLFEREVDDAADLQLDPVTNDACAAELKVFCGDGEYGAGRKLACLWEHQHDPHFGRECGAAVVEATIEQERDYRLDYRLRTYCEETIEERCAAERDQAEASRAASGAVLGCLRRDYAGLEEGACRDEILRVVAIQSELWLANEDLAKACRTDAGLYCGDKDVSNVNSCLRKNYENLSPECKDAEFQEMKVEANDVRMKASLKFGCVKELRKFCRDVSNKQSLQCLQEAYEDHEEEFSHRCRDLVEEDMEEAAQDYRLQGSLADACKRDIFQYCRNEAPEDVESCLIAVHREGERSLGPKCMTEMKSALKKEAVFTKANKKFSKACRNDIATYCGGEKPNGVHQCLIRHLDELEDACREEEMAFMTEAVADIDINVKVKKTCAKELRTVCADVPNEPGEVMRCLEDHVWGEGMSNACAAAVRPITKIKQKDIMLNPILMDKCQKDMKKLQCMPTPGKGMKKNKLLECLIGQIDKVQAKGCREAIGRKVDQRAADASLDPNIAAYCPRDVEKYCQGVEPEAMHDCLFKNLKKLSPKCAEAEFKGEKAIAKLEDQVGVDMVTRKACIAVRAAVCKEIPWDQGADALACLNDNLDAQEMTLRCKKRLEVLNERGAVDLQLSPFLNQHCSSTLQIFFAQHMCPAARENKPTLTEDGARELSCLTQNYEAINAPVCRGRVFQTMKTMVLDYKNKPGMREACEDDVRALCGEDGAEGGDYANTVDCLKDQKDKGALVGLECALHVRELEVLQGRDWLLNPALKRACSADVQAKCREVKHGESRVLACLHMNRQHISDSCGAELARVKLPKKVEKQFAQLEVTVGEGNWLELRGWMALLALSALVGVVVYFAAVHVRGRSGRNPRDYTVVVGKDGRA